MPVQIPFPHSQGSLQKSLNFNSPEVFLSLVTEFTMHIQYPIPQDT